MAKKPRKPPKRRRPPVAPGEGAPPPQTATADRHAQPGIQAQDLTGLQCFRQIRSRLGRLHDIGTKRDRAGNRDLHMDPYGVLVLRWLFHSIRTSRRGLQQATPLEAVGEKFGVGRASLGSLSESVCIFDPEPRKAIAEQLATEVPHADPGRFDVIGQRWTAVDGSLFQTAVRVAKLAWLPKGKGGQVSSYRSHTHREVRRGLPERIDITPANGEVCCCAVVDLPSTVIVHGSPGRQFYRLLSHLDQGVVFQVTTRPES